MAKQSSSSKKDLPVSTYVIIAAAGFAVSLFCVWYYLERIQGRVSEGVSQKVFYLILILFGIAASALVFGAMKSYGELSGHRFDTKYSFAGPVVGVMLVVLGGVYLPKGAAAQNLSVRVVNEQRTPLTEGKVVFYFRNYTREQAIDRNGLAVFSDIKEDDLASALKIDVSCDGYKRLTFDTVLTGFAPLQLTLSAHRTVRITGRVTTADEVPIKDVEVVAEGTPFFSHTVSNGTYSISLSEYDLGDEIRLLTSHKDFKDKVRPLQITKQQMPDVDFVLQPLPIPER